MQTTVGAAGNGTGVLGSGILSLKLTLDPCLGTVLQIVNLPMKTKDNAPTI